MFFIPGVLISAVTFPGVMVHELAHQLFCRLMRMPVYQVVYFQFKNPNGYVSHEPTDRPLANFFISVGPFIVNSLLGAVMLLPLCIEMAAFGHLPPLLSAGSPLLVLRSVFMLLSGWLGLSILMHSFPSTGDAKALIASVMKNKEVPLVFRILIAPVVGLIYVGAVGSVIWLDLGYALLVAGLMTGLAGTFL